MFPYFDLKKEILIISFDSTCTHGVASGQIGPTPPSLGVKSLAM